MFRNIWKYYIKPILLGIDPNSPEGLKLRQEKLIGDKRIDSNNYMSVSDYHSCNGKDFIKHIK